MTEKSRHFHKVLRLHMLEWHHFDTNTLADHLHEFSLSLVFSYVTVYVEANEGCNDFSLNFGASAVGIGTVATRNVKIKVR